MAVLNSHSSIRQVEAEYDDCASYAEDSDAAKARRFMTACRILLRRRPTETGSREAHLRFSPEELRQQINDARAWLSVNDTGASAAPQVTRVCFRNFRS